jgi:acetoin utilization deacetylase AcuC-like enzyme
VFPIAFHPIYQHPLPEGHRFPMLKYELLPQQLLHEGTALESNFCARICDLHPVLAIHKQEYVNDLIQLTLDQKQHGRLDFLFQRTY